MICQVVGVVMENALKYIIIIVIVVFLAIFLVGFFFGFTDSMPPVQQI